jgi:LysM repeat protein
MAITGLVAACANQPPAPPSLASTAPDVWLPDFFGIDSPTPGKSARSIASPVPAAPPPAKPRYVIVEEGRSLNGIAYSNHVSPAALAAANDLTPPYKLRVGARLLLPASEIHPKEKVSEGVGHNGSPERKRKMTAMAQLTATPKASRKQAEDTSQTPASPPTMPPINSAGGTRADATVSSPGSEGNNGATTTEENGVTVFRGRH